MCLVGPALLNQSTAQRHHSNWVTCLPTFRKHEGHGVYKKIGETSWKTLVFESFILRADKIPLMLYA